MKEQLNYVYNPFKERTVSGLFLLQVFSDKLKDVHGSINLIHICLFIKFLNLVKLSEER